MSRIGFLILFITLFFGFDYYSFSGLSLVFDGKHWFKISYWLISLLVILGFYIVYTDFRKKKGDFPRSIFTNLLLGFGFSVIVVKIVFAGLLLLQDMGLVIIRFINSIYSLFSETENGPPSRNIILIAVSGCIACIPFVSMIYGITLGKYKFEVEKIKLRFPDLPQAFHGFKIVQISDVHAGSFDSIKQVQKGIDLIKAQKADLIVFTGDLVNSLKEEINPYLEVFSSLSAPYGMYSILGNHDYYGMYQVAGKDPIARSIYMDDFNRKHKKIGFNLLNNANIKIEKNRESIRLIGVENWGAGPFPKKGDLNKALEGVNQNEFSILLSHDPTHWEHHTIPHSKHIHLTLSGHTHGMQFGVKIGKFKWSPVKYRYKYWMGLYEKAGQYLYVNRGFGFLGWPGRVGMTPEVTVLELQSENFKNEV